MTTVVDEELVDFPPPDVAPAVENEASSKKALELIQEQCVLIGIHARCWQGRHKMDDAEVHIDGHKIADEVVGEPYWDLIPKEWRKRLMRHGPRARNKVRMWSVPFVIKGLYFVPVGQAEQCLADVDLIRQDLSTDVVAFVNAYPIILRGLRIKTGDDFKRIEKKLKRQEDLPGLFEIRIIPIRVSLVEFLSGRSGTFLRQAKAAMTATVNDMIEDMIAEPREQVYSALQDLRMSLANPDKNIQQRSLDTMIRKFNKLKGFAFMADQKVLEAIQSVENQIRTTSSRVLNVKGEATETLGRLILKAEEECEADVRERRAVNKVRQRVVNVA